MTIALTLVLWSFAAISPPLDAADVEGGRAAVAADRDREAGTPLLEALVEDEDCPAVLEKSGGASGAGPLDGIARRPAGSRRTSTFRLGITSQRSRLRIRLRC